MFLSEAKVLLDQFKEKEELERNGKKQCLLFEAY